MSLIYTPINELPFAPNFEGNDYLLIWDVSQPANQARRLTFTALASFLAYTSREFEWADIINKPDTFPPAIHTHIPADIVGWDIDSLPSGTLIGGIAHFTGETPPATRRDGSLIQIGDRFKSIRDDYFWDGSKWLNTTICTASIPQFQANSIGNTTIFTGEILPNVPIWIEDCTITVTSPNFAAPGNTSIQMKIGLPRPQELIIASTLLVERNLVSQPLSSGDNIFGINAFRAKDTAGRRKLQIEFVPSGGTFNTVIGYFFLILSYRRVYV